MNSLDTNVILRFLLGDVEEQTLRATLLITTKKVYVTDVVLTEVVFVLERTLNLPREDIVTLLSQFLGFENVIFNNSLFLDTLPLYKKYSALSIVDCYAAKEAESSGNTLFTFDKQLVAQAGSHVRIPSE